MSFLYLLTPGLVQAQLTTLVEFTGNGTTNKGSSPNGLVLGSDGNFYGATCLGGSNGYGTIYKLTPEGKLTTLVEFTGKGETNRGAFPEGTLIQAKDGNFYGTTSGQGGTMGYGTVFKMTPQGTATTLVEFTNDAPPNLGSDAHSGLVQGSDGNFYGTTFAGGSGKMGTVFKVTPDGILSTLVDFKLDISPNGAEAPWGGLIEASDGNFYGTTWMGGGMPSNGGTVFRMTPAGKLTVLTRFIGLGSKSTGAAPTAGVVQGRDGNFYGTTSTFGLNNGGTVFKMTPKGVITALVKFTDNGATNKGCEPEKGLVQGRDGNFYGTTTRGGATGSGTIFQMTPEGVLTTLVEFTNMAGLNKGQVPDSELVEVSDGNFYGTTRGGGAYGNGTIFKLTLTPSMLTNSSPSSAATTTAVQSPERPPAAELIPSDGGAQQTVEGSQVRQITYSYKGTKYLLQMSFDAKALATLAANPVATGETGESLVDELGKRGGVLQDVKRNDGVLVPSEQQFSERTGKRTAAIYRQAGLRQNPAPGIAAVQGWNSDGGAPTYTFYCKDDLLQNPSPGVPASTEIQNSVTVYENYQAGKLDDPQKGTPARRCVDTRSGKCLWEGHYQNNLLQDSGNVAAWQEFDPTTGHLTLQQYCQNGLLNDPANGDPAKQIYDGKTGALVSASRCGGGKVTHVLDATELAALAARKNVLLQAAPKI